jgi:hypothetical protein
LSDIERKVWEAIASALREVGDEDIRAGLGWLESADNDSAQKRVASAAINAVN